MSRVSRVFPRIVGLAPIRAPRVSCGTPHLSGRPWAVSLTKSYASDFPRLLSECCAVHHRRSQARTQHAAGFSMRFDPEEAGANRCKATLEAVVT
jgi:hypothetical protein